MFGGRDLSWGALQAWDSFCELSNAAHPAFPPRAVGAAPPPPLYAAGGVVGASMSSCASPNAEPGLGKATCNCTHSTRVLTNDSTFLCIAFGYCRWLLYRQQGVFTLLLL